MEYAKPHLTYEDQLNQLQARGLHCGDRELALRYLKTMGYYRFSAYAYPFRVLIPENLHPASPTQHRYDDFIDGARVEDAIALCEFDHKLRSIVMEGLRELELTLRVRVAYILGKRDLFGHVSTEHLEVKGDRQEERYEKWLEKYDKHVEKAGSTDFVKHFQFKYGGDLPVWIAMEVIDFGSLTQLVGFLNKNDRNQVAEEFGVRKGGDRITRWLQNLNVVRNMCAHHSRLWNAFVAFEIGAFPAAMVGPDLADVAKKPAEKKIYRSLAVLAYMLRESDPQTNWPSTLRTRVRKFPDIEGMNPTVSMGFPKGWEDQRLWLPAHQR